MHSCPPAPSTAEVSKIKSFMGRTPGIGILKSKFLMVLGNSNDLIHGISNKLTLSINSSDSDYCDDDEEEIPKFDETIDYTKIDFESRRIKSRRAHEEIIFGRYRHPNLSPIQRLQAKGSTPIKLIKTHPSLTSSSTSSSSYSWTTNAIDSKISVSSTTRSNSIESRHSGGYGRPGRAIAGARRSDLDMQKDISRTNDVGGSNVGPAYVDVLVPFERDNLEQRNVEGLAPTSSMNAIRVPVRCKISNSSTLTSLRDDSEQMSLSLESSDWKNVMRSESQNSLPSWASSISLDCHADEEPAKAFMKKFTGILFFNAPAIGLELKSEFGSMARVETGRQWFTRFLIEQKMKSKCVDEITFHSLVQFFAIILFECSENEDFVPASLIMNLCFIFYHAIEVPGCDAYHEYLFTFMRHQPLWHTLRFWNAAFLNAVQTERERRLMLKIKRIERYQNNKKHIARTEKSLGAERNTNDASKNQIVPNGDASSSSSSHRSNAVNSNKPRNSTSEGDKEQSNDLLSQENIVFRQMGNFTCNMHALGLSQDLCLQFLKTQSISFSLSKDKTKLIKDNVFRMYHETDLWGAQES